MLPVLAALTALVLCLFGGRSSAAPRPLLRLFGSKPDSGAWPVGPGMLWGAQQAIADINAVGAVDFDIQVDWYDDACSRQRAMKSLISQLSAPVPGGNVSFHGVIGSGCSGACTGLAELSPLWGIPVLSWGCSSGSLSDTAKYPYFSRVSVSSVFHAKGWGLLARYFKWNSIASLCEREDSGLFTSAQAQLEEWMSVEVPEVKIVRTLFFKLDSSALEFARSAAREIALAHVRVVAINSYSAGATVGLCSFAQEGFVGSNWVFMTYGWFAADWISNNAVGSGCTAGEVALAGKGMLGPTDLTWSLDASLVNPAGKTPQALRKEYYDFMAANQPSDTPNDYVALVYDATWAWAYAVGSYLQEDPSFLSSFDHQSASDSSPYLAAIHSKILEQDFIGASGRVQFDDFGDRIGGLEIRQTDGNGEFVLKAMCTVEGCKFFGKVDFGLGVPWDPDEPNLIDGRVPGGQAPTCSSGLSLNIVANVCEECPSGKVFMEQFGTCVCTAGHNLSIADSDVCAPCPPGTFSSAVGLVGACSSCPAGAFSDTFGATVCTKCGLGTYQSARASTGCVGCGQFESTLMIAVESAEECLCSEGYFRRSEGTVCEECPVAMSCKAGSTLLEGVGNANFPVVDEGYMALLKDPLQVYKCLPSASCPGGAAGTCASHRDAEEVGCARCADGAYEAGEVCKPCKGGADVFPFVLIGAAGCVGLGLMTLAVNRNLLMQTNATMMCIVMLALTFTGIQTLGVFQQVSIAWFEPMASILELTSLLSFNLKVVKVGCVLGINPVSSFVFRQLVAPMSIPVVTLVLLVKRRLHPKTSVVVELVNTVGTLFNVFFISIVLSGTSPWVCFRHPPFLASSLASMISEPSVLCGGNHIHTQMVAVGIVALLLVPIPFLAMATVFTWKYPGLVLRGSEYLHAMRFLFYRFHAAKYYYGVILLSRSLLICLIPIIPGLAGNIALQTWVITAAICGYTLVQLELNPWRSYGANIMDGLISMTLVLLLMTGVMATDMNADLDSIRAAGVMAFVMFLLLVVGSMSVAIYLKLRPNPWYHYFICHHKGQAAAQARLLKVLIQSRVRLSVFIDSDDLQELDTLFDIVRCKLEHLVVYLTRETLSRPWCAGEIVTAFGSNRVKVTAVKTESFAPPTEDQMRSLDTYLDLTSCSLAEYHISTEMVAAAFGKLLASSTPSFELRADIFGSRKFELLAGQILGAQVAENKHPPPIPVKSMVLISSVPCSDEATAAASILHNKIREDVMRVAEDGCCLLADYDQDLDGLTQAVARARAVIVVLTPGTMEALPQLAAIVEVMMTVASVDQHPPQVIPVNTPGFVFPDASYYDDTLPCIWPGDSVAAATVIQSFFKRIAVFFATNASEGVLETQAKEVVARIPKNFDSKVSIVRTMTSGSMGVRSTGSHAAHGFDNEIRTI